MDESACVCLVVCHQIWIFIVFVVTILIDVVHVYITE